jgi:hypothetical protein
MPRWNRQDNVTEPIVAPDDAHGTAFSDEPDCRNSDVKQWGLHWNDGLQKILEQLEDEERRVLSVLIDLAIALMSAGLVVDILRTCF